MIDTRSLVPDRPEVWVLLREWLKLGIDSLVHLIQVGAPHLVPSRRVGVAPVTLLNGRTLIEGSRVDLLMEKVKYDCQSKVNHRYRSPKQIKISVEKSNDSHGCFFSHPMCGCGGPEKQPKTTKGFREGGHFPDLSELSGALGCRGHGRSLGGGGHCGILERPPSGHFPVLD